MNGEDQWNPLRGDVRSGFGVNQVSMDQIGVESPGQPPDGFGAGRPIKSEG